MKKALVNIHLFVGVLAAFFLIVISLSGAVIAFENELNRVFHPELTRVQVASSPINWDQFRARVEQQTPGYKLNRIYFADRPDRSTYVRMRNTSTHQIHHIYVDQYTGKVLGSTENGSNWLLKVHDLHVNFLSGKIGNQIVTWSSFALLVLALSGIILWWPRKVFRPRPDTSFPRANRDLHFTIGFWTSLVMFAFAITGLGLHYQTGKLLGLLDNGNANRRLAGQGTTIEGMLAAAHQALPGATIPRLLLSEKAGDPVFVYMRFPEDKTPAGRSFATIDPKTGEILSVGSTRTAPILQTALVQYTREIHTGTLLGLPSQIFVAVCAILLSVLCITGPLIWITRLRAAAKGRRALRARGLAQHRGQPVAAASTGTRGVS